MPTENRSCNTDPRDVFIRLNPLGLGEEELRKDTTGFEDQRTHSDYLLFLAGYRESHPETQPNPEPIAWMVGTAFWWTKEEAERDAAATGLPVVGLGPMTGAAPAGQHHGEPLPITNDMHRLMEACRIGEFKEEGGSETVEGLAVASLDAKSTMGHDADSYMAGYSAALYEQAEPFIWLSVNSQHQGEPVAWIDAEPFFGLLETLRSKIGYAIQFPVNCDAFKDGISKVWATIESLEKCVAIAAQQTYAHPGEVERLRAALKFYADREHYHFESGNWDTVSGEPLNILWCGDEPDFIEDGTVARNALSASPEPEAT